MLSPYCHLIGVAPLMHAWYDPQEMQKFDIRKLREQQLARLRDRAAQSGTLRRIRERTAQAPGLQQLGMLPRRLTPSRWREYLVPGVAVIILALALFLSTFKPPEGLPNAIVPSETSDVAAEPTIIGDEPYPGPFPEGTEEALGPTPVPTSDGLTDPTDPTDPGYPGPDEPDVPFPFETAPSIDDVPTPPVGGGVDDLFPTPEGGDEFPTTDPFTELPPDEYPPPDFGQPDPGTGSQPPAFPTEAPVSGPRGQNPAAGITTIPPPVFEDPINEFPTEEPFPTDEPFPPDEQFPPVDYPPPVDDFPEEPPTPTVRGGPAGGVPTPTVDPAIPEESAIPEEPTPEGEDPLPDDNAPPTEEPSPAPEPTEIPPTPLPTATPTPTPVPVTRLEGAVRWTLEQSPIIIERDTVIVPDASLQIDPGVEVRFKPNTNIYIEGRLTAGGTAGNPVRFSGPEGRWGALVGQPGSMIELSNAEIRNAGRGGIGVSSTSGQLMISNSRIVDGGGGIVASGSAVDIRNSQVTGNDLAAGPAVNIILGPQSPTTLQGNIFGGNQVPRGTPQVRLIAGSTGNGPLEITGNAFSAPSGPLLDLQTASAISGTIRCNGFRAGTIGLQMSSSTPSANGFRLAIDTNAFEGQTVGGAASTVALNTSNNWWSDPSGPNDVTRNPQGRGVRAGINITFDPWLQGRPACAPTP